MEDQQHYTEDFSQTPQIKFQLDNNKRQHVEHTEKAWALGHLMETNFFDQY